MDKRLRNRVALITGTSGAGLAAAKRFAAEGAEVVVTARDAEMLARARRELDGVANVAELDATDQQKVARLFASLGRKHGRLDILFFNAGSVAEVCLALEHAIPILSDGAAVIVDTSIIGRNVRLRGLSVGDSQKSADEIASAAAFLASRDSLLTGAELAAGGTA